MAVLMSVDISVVVQRAVVAVKHAYRTAIERQVYKYKCVSAVERRRGEIMSWLTPTQDMIQQQLCLSALRNGVCLSYSDTHSQTHKQTVCELPFSFTYSKQQEGDIVSTITPPTLMVQLQEETRMQNNSSNNNSNSNNSNSNHNNKYRSSSIRRRGRGGGEEEEAAEEGEGLLELSGRLLVSSIVCQSSSTTTTETVINISTLISITQASLPFIVMITHSLTHALTHAVIITHMHSYTCLCL